MSTTRSWHLTTADDPAEAVVKTTRLDDEPAPGSATRYRIELDGRTVECLATVRGDQVVLVVDGRSHVCHVHQGASDRAEVHVDGHHVEVGLISERDFRRRTAHGGGFGDDGPLVASPMAGRVVAVKVAAGDVVEPGQTLLIVEAMKMENDIKASRSGVVESVAVTAGDTVEVGSELLRIGDAPD